MPLVIEVLMGRHFFVKQPCCFAKFTYGGEEFCTDTVDGATNPKWQKTKFQLPYEGKGTPVEISFSVMNRKGREESEQIASCTVKWASFLPGLRKVEDYIVKADVDGVKDTAAIRVAATLLPEGITGDPQREEPNRKAFLVGISYPDTKYWLPHCNHDAEVMRYMLCGPWGGFPDSTEKVRVLMDTPGADESAMPTRENIRTGLSWLAHEAVAGDSLLFFYSGHGTQRPNMNDREKDGRDEALVPCDMDVSGILVDDEIYELLVKPLPAGVRLTVMLDCCHSGSGLDLPYCWNPYMEGEKGEWQLDKGGYYSDADVICLSGCADDETAVGLPHLAHGGSENICPLGMPTGMCAASFWVAWEVHMTQCKMNWTEMLNIIKNVLQDFRMKQHVQLSSSQKFDLTREFDFHDCIPNSNDRSGPVSSGGEVRGRGEPVATGRNKLKEANFMSSGPMQMMSPEMMQQLGFPPEVISTLLNG